LSEEIELKCWMCGKKPAFDRKQAFYFMEYTKDGKEKVYKALECVEHLEKKEVLD